MKVTVRDDQDAQSKNGTLPKAILRGVAFAFLGGLILGYGHELTGMALGIVTPRLRPPGEIELIYAVLYGLTVGIWAAWPHRSEWAYYAVVPFVLVATVGFQLIQEIPSDQLDWNIVIYPSVVVPLGALYLVVLVRRVAQPL